MPHRGRDREGWHGGVGRPAGVGIDRSVSHECIRVTGIRRTVLADAGVP